jgi:hypothetical protein
MRARWRPATHQLGRAVDLRAVEALDRLPDANPSQVEKICGDLARRRQVAPLRPDERRTVTMQQLGQARVPPRAMA